MVVVAAEAAAEAEEVAEEVTKAVAKEAVATKSPTTDGPTSPSMLTTHHLQSVKNIIFTGKVLTGVKSQLPVPGRTIFCPRINETGASLTITTYKKPCIHTKTTKYIQLV